MRKGVIIVAGGKGERMGANLPKQFLLLKEKPILMHTIERFFSFDESMEIVIVLPESMQDYWKEICEKYNFTISHKVTNGGKTRFHSVKNGLALIQNSDVIGIHDGVRPLVSKSTLENCYKTAQQQGSAIPVIPIVESIRKIEGNSSKSCNRADYRTVQTPQVFQEKWLRDSYNVSFEDFFTDDASVVEYAGHSVSLVDGNIENIKITSPIDLVVGEFLIEGKTI